MLVDDEQRLWLSTFTDSETEVKWWVLDKDGQLLAEFTWPGRRMNRVEKRNQIKAVKNGYLYEVQTDSVTDTQTIVKYQVVITERD